MLLLLSLLLCVLSACRYCLRAAYIHAQRCMRANGFATVEWQVTHEVTRQSFSRRLFRLQTAAISAVRGEVQYYTV
jgi:hypothetical protein